MEYLNKFWVLSPIYVNQIQKSDLNWFFFSFFQNDENRAQNGKTALKWVPMDRFCTCLDLLPVVLGVQTYF